ncbi:DUF4268 domain-containing protein [Mucilaginibacter robiniae]|uniref:DUF4268 domain-containing protein n=2 Tax=Mucilaginibacter robiniae TaxID=2728022 RepID=A0A7L5EAT9_9SPHI|nr:DUF4268 domain-containing protein [Mucilaginibacter robiniae]
MYSKEQSSQIKQTFWTTFGQYIAPQPSAEGLRINWINYKTCIKYVNFRMQVENRSASIGIEISHPDTGIQELFFEQFQELKLVLHDALQEEWTWNLHSTGEYGKTISRIYKELSGVSIFNRDDWPKLISFFKPRIVALDEFWSDAKYSFDALK